MTIRLISAKGVADDLAAARITAREQSLYLIASFLIWIIPAYLFLFPTPRTDDPHFFWLVWLIELAFLVLFCVVGIGFCLGKCRVDPTMHFLVDFSCLNAPVSLTTLTLVWGGFYILTEPVLALVGGTFPWLTSSRAYDVVRMFASAGAVFIVFLRIGKHMDRVSLIRESANNTVERDARPSLWTLGGAPEPVRSFRLPIRILGVLLGAFAVFSAIANILGFVPNSVEPWPSLLSRFLSSLPSLAGGFVLLIPMRHFSSGIGYRLLAVAYVMLCLAATALAIGGVIGYAQGIKHWAVLPVGIVILAIVAANGLLLRHARHQANVAT